MMRAGSSADVGSLRMARRRVDVDERNSAVIRLAQRRALNGRSD